MQNELPADGSDCVDQVKLAPVEHSLNLPAEEESLRCIRCGYDLRGQPFEGSCPECGLSIELTHAVGTHLQRGRPGWLHRLAIGAWLLVLAPFAAILVPFSFAASRYGQPSWLTFAAIAFVALLHMLAVWLLTSREHRFEHQLAGHRLRAALRFCGTGSIVIAGCLVLLIFDPRSVMLQYIALECFALLIPTYVLIFLHLRTLARRINHASLAEHCGIVAVGVSISIAMLLVAPWIIPFFDSNGTRHADLWAPLLGLTTILLFLIWSTYLLLRFAIVFQTSARKAALNWANADASLVGL